MEKAFYLFFAVTFLLVKISIGSFQIETREKKNRNDKKLRKN